MKTLLVLILSILSFNSAQTADIIFSDRRDADSFKRISEYLSGEEDPGRYVIARTDPSQRDGYYIALKLEASDQPEKADKARLHFVRPGSQDIETKTLTIGPINKNRALIGMTDDVWGTTRAIPTAWKIEFLDSAGAVISSSQSFLWSNRS
jgi:hypothetical protein